MFEELTNYIQKLTTVQWILIICILFVIGYLIYLLIDSQNCEPFTASSDNSKEYAFYYMNGCVFCEKYKNEGGKWYDVINLLKDKNASVESKDGTKTYKIKNLIIKEVNCDQGCSAKVYNREDLSKSYDIQGFPTVTYKKDGKEIEGDRNEIADEILSQLK